VVGFTTGSRGEVPGKKENLWQETMMIIIIIIVDSMKCIVIAIWVTSDCVTMLIEAV
jgi:hypothetical protein